MNKAMTFIGLLLLGALYLHNVSEVQSEAQIEARAVHKNALTDAVLEQFVR